MPHQTRNVQGLAVLAEYLGDGAALRAAMTLGGESVKVPRRCAGAMWQRLVAALGAQDAASLVEAFGGEQLYIARNAEDERAARRADAQRLLAQGLSYAEVARRLRYEVRYTERGLRKLVAGGCPGQRPEASCQVPLFAAEKLGPEPAAVGMDAEGAGAALHAVWGQMVFGSRVN